MNTRMIGAVCAVCGLLAAATVVQAQEVKQTETSIHNFGKRKVIHAHKYVNNRMAHSRYYMHRKAHNVRNWLNHH